MAVDIASATANLNSPGIWNRAKTIADAKEVGYDAISANLRAPLKNKQLEDQRLEEERQFFIALANRLNPENDIQQIEYDISRLKGQVTAVDSLLDSFMYKVAHATSEVFHSILGSPENHGAPAADDLSAIQRTAEETQLAALDMLMTKDALKSLDAFKAQREVVIEKRKICAGLCAKVITIQGELKPMRLEKIREEQTSYTAKGLEYVKWGGGLLGGAAKSAYKLVTQPKEELPRLMTEGAKNPKLAVGSSLLVTGCAFYFGLAEVIAYGALLAGVGKAMDWWQAPPPKGSKAP